MSGAAPHTAAVVIPAFNEASTIATIARGARGHVADVIVVDDGSGDGTAECLSGVEVTVVRNHANLGKASSIRRGARLALARGATCVVTMDGDGQHQTDDLPALLDAARRNPGAIVIGARSRYHGDAPKLRRFANRFADFWISWACGRKVFDTQSGFRVYPKDVLLRLDVPTHSARGFVFESEILIEALRAGWSVCPVDVTTTYAADGRQSHYRPFVDTARLVRMIAGKLLRKGLDPLGLLRSLGFGANTSSLRALQGASEADIGAVRKARWQQTPGATVRPGIRGRQKTW